MCWVSDPYAQEFVQRVFNEPLRQALRFRTPWNLKAVVLQQAADDCCQRGEFQGGGIHIRRVSLATMFHPGYSTRWMSAPAHYNSGSRQYNQRTDLDSSRFGHQNRFSA